MIQEIKITSCEQLIKELNDLPNNYIFRGHSNSKWKLESTLERVLGEKWSADKARKFEDLSLYRFQSKYHIYNTTEHPPKSKLSWLSVMQHYGVPTRLLDFTESPYVALYFALETYDHLHNNDLAIYALDYKTIMDKSIEYIKAKDSKFSYGRNEMQFKNDDVFEDFVDRHSYDILWITEPFELNVRMDRQSGTFLISGNRVKTIQSIINSQLYEDCKIFKYLIQSEIYENVYTLLRKMNINSKSIYGDLIGLAKAIKMEMQVYTK
jgi:hypothetical protein